ncbi:MAG TPA: phosphotransferase [Candidatus Syntrophosphaera sp.]|nr:phosphotransferase [Candidatus Syntrophosphaera sp.]
MSQALYSSAKATVELLPRSVVKRFNDPEDFYRELRVYQAGLPMVPKLLRFGEREWIEMERVMGQPHLDADFGPEAASRLAIALAGFHRAWFSEGVCLCHWDNQPKNILRAGDDFWFIDFSESRLAPPEADLTHLLLFWAAEYHAEAFRTLCGAFLDAYAKVLPLPPNPWQTALQRSLERFSARRRNHSRRRHHVGQGDFAANLQFLSSLGNETP